MQPFIMLTEETPQPPLTQNALLTHYYYTYGDQQLLLSVNLGLLIMVNFYLTVELNYH